MSTEFQLVLEVVRLRLVTSQGPPYPSRSVGASVSLRQKRILTKTAVKGIERPLLPFGA
jgi:hypothetical protein